MLMKRVNMIQPGVLQLENVPVPTPGDGQVLVKVKVVGVCGSDVHAFRGEHPFISCPIVPGHEFSGVVARVGGSSSTALIGTRATALPSLVCGSCYNCRHGRQNICSNLRVIGCQAGGAMAEYVLVPVDFLVPLPNAVSFDDGAMVEPLAVAVHAVRHAGSIAGARALVLGAGTIGLLVAKILKVYGASEVIVSDPNDDRRHLAQDYGADYVIDPTTANVPAWVRAQFGSDGIDVSFECVGVAATVSDALRSARKGTKVVIVGVFKDDILVPMGLVQDREIELVGTLMYTKDDFEEAARLVSRGIVHVGRLTTHRFTLDDAQEAYETANDPLSGAVKVLIQVP